MIVQSSNEIAEDAEEWKETHQEGLAGIKPRPRSREGEEEADTLPTLSSWSHALVV